MIPTHTIAVIQSVTLSQADIELEFPLEGSELEGSDVLMNDVRELFTSSFVWGSTKTVPLMISN
jgi:hypothetical protein